MTDTEQPDQTTAHVRAAQRADAQARAFTWAERAEDDHVQALNAETDVRTLREKPFVTKELDRALAAHTLHTEHSERAVRMAEMWARVARAFT